MNIRHCMLIVMGGYYNTWTEHIVMYCIISDNVSSLPNFKYGLGHCNSGYAYNPYLYEFCFTCYCTNTFALIFCQSLPIFCSIHIRVVHTNMLNRCRHAYDCSTYNSSPEEEGVVNVSISLCSRHTICLFLSWIISVVPNFMDSFVCFIYCMNSQRLKVADSVADDETRNYLWSLSIICKALWNESVVKLMLMPCSCDCNVRSDGNCWTCSCCDAIYEGHLESKERFAIKKYLLIIGKKKNMQILSHTFAYFST